MDPTSSHAINAMIDNCSMKIVRIKIWQHETRSKLLNSPIIRLRTGNRYFFIVEERVGKVDDRLFSNSRKSSRKSIRVAFRALAIFYEVGRRTAIKPFPQAKMTVNDSTIISLRVVHLSFLIAEIFHLSNSVAVTPQLDCCIILFISMNDIKLGRYRQK